MFRVPDRMPQRAQDFDFLATNRVGCESRRGFHRNQREELQHMILNHVAQCAGPVVIPTSAILDADRLGHRDLHELDMMAIPERLEDRIVEAKAQQVLDRLLAQVVVDTIDLLFL